MKDYPKLTLKLIQKRHKKNPQDKELHKVIESEKGDATLFNNVIEKGTKQKPFDKKKKSSR